MQLAHAIDAWVEAHGTNLSSSTQNDIAHIASSAISVGWAELPCADVEQDVLDEIVAEASQVAALSDSAITEFLGVVLRWDADREAQRAQLAEQRTQLTVTDDLGPTGAFLKIDDDESDDDNNNNNESDDDDDDDHDDDDHDDDDHDDDDHDDESDDDDDESDDDDDDDVEDAAASSFFEALGASTPLDDDEPLELFELGDDLVGPDNSAGGGVFSVAAEHIPPKPATGIDWITVAYFTVAAVCFALVIYFYLSS